ncbi:nuclear transport factor 2 family protein [Altererythrobacter sp. KTW20L]|uniref:nuclear transport factor 2 family protein n=1 Tax=Altererythrobacter sp. KTW20L TaxID=2942210 RepID=UPI0020BD6230|nr:nuclear transport factor 2 family protein [Altererythrobacter sp. KTW20L]MCL6250337.1 nuclear transport factor 2 family protein [Altererythrobacter sp. KTW20L]
MDEGQRRAIEADVTRLIHAYTWANDDADWHACAALYTDNARFSRPSGGEAIVGREAILAGFLARAPRVQRHAIANVLVDVVDENTARARSVIVLYMGDAAPDGLPVQDVKSPLVGTFTDLCVRTTEGWRFAERVGGLDFRP